MSDDTDVPSWKQSLREVRVRIGVSGKSLAQYVASHEAELEESARESDARLRQQRLKKGETFRHRMFLINPCPQGSVSRRGLGRRRSGS